MGIEKKHYVLLLFGPQGSGKGTQAKMISEKNNFLHFSIGDALRAETKKGTLLGKKIKSIIDSGTLVPAELTNDIVKNIDLKGYNGIILDGYPRSKDQLNFFLKNYHIDAALELKLTQSESIKRIASRRMCPKCARNYNTLYLAPKKTGICDDCGTVLVQRDDDMPDSVKKRLSIYKLQTLPLKLIYRKMKVLHLVDASGSIEDVNRAIRLKLKL
jgi:adenylate kinase